MSLQLAAKHLAAQGRGPDRMLVHMSPREVHSLQAIAKASGGSLTINPQTGLPEAGFLSSILPMLAGAALTYFSGGMINPATAGLLVGGGTAAATGSLQKGLMAGLGAYGGGGLGNVVTGAAGAAPAAAGAAPAAATPAAEAISGAGSAGVAGASAPSAAGITGATPMATGVAGPAPITTATYTPPSELGASEVFTKPAPPANSEGIFSKYGRGFEAISKKPEILFNKENLGYGLSAALPVASEMMKPPSMRSAKDDDEQYTYSYDPNRVDRPTPYGGTGETTFFNPTFTRMAANGGLMDLPVERMSARNEAEAMMANGGQMYAAGGEIGNIIEKITTPRDSSRRETYSYDPATQQYTGGTSGPSGGIAAAAANVGDGYQPAKYAYNAGNKSYAMTSPEAEESFAGPDWSGGIGLAEGGVSHLGDYSDGGRLLRGPGDGVSDDIPATIADKRPARLADGEFVVPARIVSELGNGSTEAGARKLYAMMNRVQKNRAKTVGEGKVAVNSRSDKYLPA